MYTSYFAKSKQLDSTNLVSIASKTPTGFKGREYKILAPKYDWWIEWKTKGLSNKWYIDHYYSTVLNNLDPLKVYKDLGDDAILLCYERPEKFCHRHIVASWLREAGYLIEELDIDGFIRVFAYNRF